MRTEALHHVLHLLLCRVSVADHRLLHLQGGVLGDRQAGQHCGADRGAARLPQRERGLRIGIHENFLHRDFARHVRGNHFLQAFQDGLQARGEVAGAGLRNRSRCNEGEFRSLSITRIRHLQTRIDPRDPQSTTAVV